jgi:hypothetical protein
MPTTYINATEHGATDTRTILAKIAELLPSGTGYVRILPDGTLTIDTPSGGGGGSEQTFFEEILTVATDNVIPQCTFIPKYETQDFWLTLGSGWVRHSVKEGGFTVNAATRTVTITPLAQYVVKAGWAVTLHYATDEDTSAPTITSVTPSPVTVGETLTITGTNFRAGAVVTIGGQTVTATVVNSTQITVVVPALIYSGTAITVQTVTGTATNNGFNFTTPLPTLASFAPTSQQAGLQVVITGTNFYGVSQVQFGGVNATAFTVNSPTQITATVGAGASGSVSLVTMYGSASLAGFTFTSLVPLLTSFTPSLATGGTDVVITGVNFGGATAVQVNGANVHSFTIDSPTQITARVSKTQTTGTIAVTTAAGTVTSVSTLTVDQILPFPRTGRIMTGNASVINGRNYETTATSNNTFFGASEPYFPFTLDLNDRWYATTPTNQRLVLRVPIRARISSYTIKSKSGNPGSSLPRSWQIQGSNDGLAWTTLQTVTNFSSWGSEPITNAFITTQSFALSNEFEYLAIFVQTANGDNPMISEFIFDVTL